MRIDGFVPGLDEPRVHLADGGEGPLPDVERAVVAEMAVAGEEEGHPR